MSSNLVPPEYIPFERVWICGSRFDRGRVVLEAGGVPVFLIGQPSTRPLVWLYTRLNGNGLAFADEEGPWKLAVRESVAVIDGFEVGDSNYGSAVLFRNHPILEYRIQDGVLVISAMDLRPIGLNVGGNIKRMVIGGSTFEGSNFDNVVTMFSVG